MSKNTSGKIGFCINQPEFERISNQVIEKLKNIGTPALSDSLNKFNALGPEIKPVYDDLILVGQAFTVRMRPGDNLMLHKAISMAGPGDVIMVDTCGCQNYSVLGDLMVSAAMKRGISGIVVDGGIRDIRELREKKASIFAKTHTPAVGDKDGPGEINSPISCGGVPVLPGDIIVGDINGVVVIPKHQLDIVIEGAEKKLAYEVIRAQEIEDGLVTKRDIDKKLRAAGIIE